MLTGIYIHVPWCRRRCPYCDYYFEIQKPKSSIYAQAIAEEFSNRYVSYAEKIDTVYFGGGSPSYLPAAAIAKILSNFKESQLQEIAIEANPEDIINSDKAKSYRDIGITRLSLGVQSLRDEILHYLGRKHRSEQAKNAINKAVTSGIENISIDIIIGVPSQNTEQILKDIDWSISLGVNHFSIYMLTIEENAPLKTLIKQGKRTMPCDDQTIDQYQAVISHLQTVNFEHYEISNFSLPGKNSIHNKIYWGGGKYIGLGPGAHSMLINNDGGIIRYSNINNFNLWVNSPSKSHIIQEELTPKQALLESIAFSLRNITAGANLHILSARHEIKISNNLLVAIDKLIENNWLSKRGEILTLTNEGILFADAVCREIIGCEA